MSSSSPRLLLGAALLAACGSTSSPGSPDAARTADARNADAAAGSPDAAAGDPCHYMLSAYNSSPKVHAMAVATWACTATQRQLTGAGIPEHAVVGGNFATPISTQVVNVAFPLAPAITSPTGTGLNHKPYGYAMNSVKFDPGTDGTCASGATSTMPGGGCVAVMGHDPWHLEAMGGAFMFGTDENNAHVQPNGAYHYHGMPEGMLGGAHAMVRVGYAMDGFPIYARYGYATAGDPASGVKVIASSYRKKAAPDAGRPSTTIFPMGTFTEDYEYVAGLGDLDECNGRMGATPDSATPVYHYYITDTFPFIQRCLKGTPL